MSALTDDFNRTVRGFFKEEKISTSRDLVIVKYETLFRHKANAEEKATLIAALFDCGTRWLRSLASDKQFLDGDTFKELEPIFATLVKPGHIEQVPPRATAELADIALQFVAAAEKPCSTSSELQHAHLVGAAKLAGMALEYADLFRKHQEDLVARVATAQPVVASKPFSIKAAPQ